ncbi:MAG: pyridoxal-phosphate dependent enzyme, partial [Syntrophomonadaceae bacterium]
AVERRIRPWVPETPLRRYPPLDAAVGRGVAVFVKHENHAPTNAFKVRNAFSVMTALSEEERRSGVVTPTRGNHGLGVAYAGAALGVRRWRQRNGSADADFSGRTNRRIGCESSVIGPGAGSRQPETGSR